MYFILSEKNTVDFREQLMNENTRMDIRRLLKKFGVQADEAIISHLAK